MSTLSIHETRRGLHVVDLARRDPDRGIPKSASDAVTAVHANSAGLQEALDRHDDVAAFLLDPVQLVEPIGEHAALELELSEQRIDVRGVLLRATDHGDEVAVPTAMCTERQMHVERNTL